MNPAQQQLVAQWNQELHQAGGQLSQLLQQAGAGCQQMIAQNPTDPLPLNNAIGAIEHQVKDIRSKADDTFSAYYDRVSDAGPSEPSYSTMKRTLRAFERWAEETWARFDAHWHVEQYRAMWPYAQQAMQKPVACSGCGGPLARTTPHRSESLTCGACRTVNQVLPDAVVAGYYGGMPHYYAEFGLIEKRSALQKFRDDWEDYRDAEHAADRDRPEEPLERLEQREQMEREYWTAYAEARVRNEGGTADDVRTLVEARMKQAFYDEMNLNDVWRAAHGMQSVSAQVSVPEHLKNVDEWGPLNPHQNPNALEDDFVHDALLSEAMTEPARYESGLYPPPRPVAASKPETPRGPKTALARTLGLSGLVAAGVGAVGVGATYGLYEAQKGDLSRDKFDNLRLANDVSWLVVFGGAGMWAVSELLPREVRPTSASRSRATSQRAATWSAAVGPGSVAVSARY